MTRRHLARLFASAVTAFTVLAWAQPGPRWALLEISADDTRLYFDESRVLRRGTAATAWVLRDRSGDPPADENWRSIVLRVEADCSTQAMRHLGHDAYEDHMATGRLVSSRVLDAQPFRATEPGSTSRRIVERACADRAASAA